jgi:hypothetical protein
VNKRFQPCIVSEKINIETGVSIESCEFTVDPHEFKENDDTFADVSLTMCYPLKCSTSNVNQVRLKSKPLRIEPDYYTVMGNAFSFELSLLSVRNNSTLVKQITQEGQKYSNFWGSYGP